MPLLILHHLLNVQLANKWVFTKKKKKSEQNDTRNLQPLTQIAKRKIITLS
jgi:hypothetical protein